MKYKVASSALYVMNSRDEKAMIRTSAAVYLMPSNFLVCVVCVSRVHVMCVSCESRVRRACVVCVSACMRACVCY